MGPFGDVLDLLAEVRVVLLNLLSVLQVIFRYKRR